ncbi:MAG TPA: glycosyltransferase family 9 protein [Thermoanaerobaculia bacterium]|nr:glycosyltransferase family 9 protein [Thermoanaerobaculia bacterium]
MTSRPDADRPATPRAAGGAAARRLRMPLAALRRSGGRLAGGALEVLIRAAADRAPALAVAPEEPRSIFVLRNNDIGDLLVATPLFAALRRRFPAASIAAGVGSWNLPVLQNNPHLSEVLAVNAPWHNKYLGKSGAGRRLLYLWRSPEVRELAQRRFTVGIDVLGSGWGSLLLLRARIPYRLGVRGYAGGDSGVQAAVTFDPSEHVGRSTLRFAELLGATWLPPCRPQLFLTVAEYQAAESWWAASESGRRCLRIVIGPGGGLPARRWPQERFAEVARELAAVAERAECPQRNERGLGALSILVLGGPHEGGQVAAVAAAAAPLGRTHPEAPGLRETFALVAASDLVLCNSSMLMHVAAAFSKPTIVVLGEAFSSARLHQAQWGYAGTCRSLGKEPGSHAALATPEEALQAVRDEIEPERPVAAGCEIAGVLGADAVFGAARRRGAEMERNTTMVPIKS